MFGPADHPRWARPALLGLLVATAILYFWHLSANGWGNSFYAAAVQAGTKSWKAFFFGSFDSAGFITVDKPPASLWVMEISTRIFGFSSLSMLAPQALEGVASVGILYAAVSRRFGPASELIAGGLLAVTPVAVLMFRFNNPDALLVLLMVAAAYCVIRAAEAASPWWLALAGTLIGFGFLTKMLQVTLVLPALALVYLICAPTSFRRRIAHLALAGIATVVSAGWWVAIVALVPAADRPYIGGSTDNSVLQLAFGYNGLTRLTGSSFGPGANFSGPPGILRLFNDLLGSQISWLLPAAVLAVLGGAWMARGEGRSGRTVQALILWGGWLLVTALVFSLSKGVIHTYYAVALAPPIAALVGIVGVQLWQRRHQWFGSLSLALMTAVTTWWSYELLLRTPSWHPELRYLVVGCGAVATAWFLAKAPWGWGVAAAGMLATTVALAAGSLAYAADTVASQQSGPTPFAGPSVAGSQGGFGGGGPTASFGQFGAAPPLQGVSTLDGSGNLGLLEPTKTKIRPKKARGEGRLRKISIPGSLNGLGGLGPKSGEKPPAGALGGPPPGQGSTPLPGGAPPAEGSVPGLESGHPGVTRPLPRTTRLSPKRRSYHYTDAGNTAPLVTGNGGQSSAAVMRVLERTSTTWAAATIGSQTAGSLELGTGKAIMAIGGFSGSDPAPTLQQFEQYVANGRVRYFIAGGAGFGGGGGGAPGGPDTGGAITTWVEAHFKALTVGGQTVYDLSHRTRM